MTTCAMTGPERPVLIVDVDGTLFDPAERRKFVEPLLVCNSCFTEYATEEAIPAGGCSCGYGDVRERPKDWDAFFAPENVLKDTPKLTIVKLVQRHGMTHEIHIVTGRREADRDVTVKQLRSVGIPYAALHIVRPNGCHKPDDVLKREWLEDSGLKDRIDFILDDRSSVVAMWREQGLTCLQVAPGDF